MVVSSTEPTAFDAEQVYDAESATAETPNRSSESADESSGAPSLLQAIRGGGTPTAVHLMVTLLPPSIRRLRPTRNSKDTSAMTSLSSADVMMRGTVDSARGKDFHLRKHWVVS